MGPLPRVHGGKRERGRELSDFCHAFRFAPPELDYPTYVALVLNLDRLRVQQAVSVAIGTQAALSSDPLAPIWGDAVALDAVQSEEVLHRANAARAEHRRRSRRPHGH